MLLSLSLLAAVASAQARDADTDFTWHLLTDDDTQVVINGTDAVAQLSAPDRATLDLVAELLVERTRAHAGDAADIDTVAWLFRALGAGRDARYRGVVEQAMATYQDKKVNGFGRDALAQMAGDAAESYVAGTVSLPTVRAELAERRKSTVGRHGSLASLRNNTAIATVIETLGYPADFLERLQSRGHAGIKVRVRSLRMVYPGQGLVDVGNTGQGWGVTGVFPDVPNQAPPYVGEFGPDAALLMTSDPTLLVKVAARLRRGAVREPALLDRAAERLRLSLGTRDEFEASALSHLTHLLADSGERRYADVLRAAAAGAEEGSLRRHAEESLAQLIGG